MVETNMSQLKGRLVIVTRVAQSMGHLNPAFARSCVAATVTRVARFVGLALYMVDPIYGPADPALVAEYSSGPTSARKRQQRRSTV